MINISYRSIIKLTKSVRNKGSRTNQKKERKLHDIIVPLNGKT